jgi:hypothetical protein
MGPFSFHARNIPASGSRGYHMDVILGQLVRRRDEQKSEYCERRSAWAAPIPDDQAQ